MRTLVANFYRKHTETKLPPYLSLVGRYSEPVEVAGERLEPGYDIDGFNAVVITGSQWMLAEEDAPAAIKEFVRGLKIPTLGICFGHQLMARAWEAEVFSGELVERTETVLVAEPGPLFAGLGPEVEMLESHREHVDFASMERVGWHVIAGSASCRVEAMHHPTRPLYGVQFHPERSGPNGEALLANLYNNIVRPFWQQRGC